jgi:hypothetical protein
MNINTTTNTLITITAITLIITIIIIIKEIITKTWLARPGLVLRVWVSLGSKV